MTAAPIGILCLNTSFEKVPGHIRNPTTFDFPVIYRVIEGATPQRLVREADPTLLEPVVAAAKELQAAGAAGITGACGFLVLFQAELAAALSVSIWASSLVQLPMVYRMVGRPVGLLVADEAALTPRHLAAIGAESVPVRVTGMADQPEFREVMMEGRRDDLDTDRLEREVLDRVDRLAEAHPDLGALVIECTDLVPYAHAIQARLGLPVFDIVTLTNMVHATLTRHPYPRHP
ncbi:aspartate/glutamate racemase family protein [Micromonospora sp. NBC_01412]|uniref:aspartate/glutamate racemase family protein n=1 Tax=Micromonospora sp. NBC_01412 TaxID=2903590 RepID=UPI003246F3E5